MIDRRTTTFAALMFVVSCKAGPIDIAEDNSLLQGLVAHWALDETSGTMVSDSSGMGHSGVLSTGNGGAWLPSPSGQFGGALHFEQGTEVSVSGFPDATTAWTVALWVRPTAATFANQGYTTLLSTEQVFIGGWEMNLQVTANGPRFEFGYYVGPKQSDYFTADCQCVMADKWTHLVGVANNDLKRILFYENGLLRAEGDMLPGGTRGPIKPGNKTLYMGRWETFGSRQLKGADLDDIAIYNRALDSVEISQLAQKPAPNPP